MEIGLALLNTRHPHAPDTDPLHDPRRILPWVSGHLAPMLDVTRQRWTLPELRELGHEAQALRAAALSLVEAHVQDEAPPPSALDGVARSLEAGRWTYGLGREAGVRLIEHLVDPTSPLSLLSPFARSIVLICSEADPRRLRRCAAPTCARWFLDESRNGRRRWCSMATCGNRAKAARFRARHAERS